MRAFELAKLMLLNPREGWKAVQSLQIDIKSLFSEYLLIYFGIAAVCHFINLGIIGMPVQAWGGFERVGLFAALYKSALLLLLFLGLAYVMALVLQALVPQFSGSASLVDSLKVATFTAGAMQFFMAPLAVLAAALGMIGMLLSFAMLGLAIYTIYIFWIGAPIMLRIPAEKNLVFCLVAFVACAITNMLIVWTLAALGLNPYF